MTQPQPSFEELRAIYEELRRTARRMLNREPYAHTLESMELVHQAWARLLSGDMRALTEQEPRQVLALAVLNMRRELVDHARRRRATKRPDPTARVDLADVSLLSETDPHTFLEIDRLIDSLERGAAHAVWRSDWRPARGVAGRAFAGLSESCDGLGGPGAPRLGSVGHGPPASHSRRRPVKTEGAPS